MVDRRRGAVPAENVGGLRPPATRRPGFEDQRGDTYEADNARDAAMASGAVRGDLRGQPAADAPGQTYVSTHAPRRRRPAVEAAPEPRDDYVEREEQAARGTATDRDNDNMGGERGARSAPRDNREYADREFSEDRELTDDERIEMLSRGFFQEVLPDLPKKPGRHRCWLTTTNPRDPIAGRLRMGYRLLRLEDLGPGWEQSKATSGEYAGSVVINEMIAAEMSEALYQRIMKLMHHDRPRDAEKGIYGRIEEIAAGMRDKGSRLVMEDKEENGFDSMRGFVKAPQQFE